MEDVQGDAPGRASDADRNSRIVQMRDAGASWKDIQAAFGLTRQQARYAYQLGKRAERRKARSGAS